MAKKKAAKKAAKAGKEKTGKKAAPKKSAKKAKAAAKPTIGRPTVTAEEKLFMLFHDDYHARQIFEFLRVETVRELEQYSPQEIVQRLSQPIRRTVDVIRRKLASKNRALAGDEEFAARHKAETPPPTA